MKENKGKNKKSKKKKREMRTSARPQVAHKNNTRKKKATWVPGRRGCINQITQIIKHT